MEPQIFSLLQHFAHAFHSVFMVYTNSGKNSFAYSKTDYGTCRLWRTTGEIDESATIRRRHRAFAVHYYYIHFNIVVFMTTTMHSFQFTTPKRCALCACARMANNNKLVLSVPSRRRAGSIIFPNQPLCYSTNIFRIKSTENTITGWFFRRRNNVCFVASAFCFGTPKMVVLKLGATVHNCTHTNAK